MSENVSCLRDIYANGMFRDAEGQKYFSIKNEIVYLNDFYIITAIKLNQQSLNPRDPYLGETFNDDFGLRLTIFNGDKKMISRRTAPNFIP